MLSEQSVWIIEGVKTDSHDLAQWVEKTGKPLRMLRASELEEAAWQLGPRMEPPLIVVDARGEDIRRRTGRQNVESWMQLARARAWEAPMLLCVSRLSPGEECGWGRQDATEVLVSPSGEMFEEKVKYWMGRRVGTLGHSAVSLLAVLRDTGAVLAQAGEDSTRWRKFLRALLRHFRARTGSILLLNTSDASTLTPLTAIGLPVPVAQARSLPLAGSITERVIQEDRSLLLQGRLTRGGEVGLQGRHAVPPSSAIAVPLRCGDQVLGSLNVSRVGQAARFMPSDLFAVEIVAVQVALAVANMRLLDRVRESERLAVVGRTTAEISHCVKNILTGVKGAMFLLERGLQQGMEDLLPTSLGTLKHSVGRLQNLIGDLLDISKKREPDPRPVDLRGVMTDLENQLRYRCDQQKVELAVSACDKIPILMLEEDRLFRSLMNLGLNAIDAMPAGGRLEIKAQWHRAAESHKSCEVKEASPPGAAEAPGMLEVCVLDTGYGIPPDIIDKIFDGFFSTKGSGGTGLGLASVRKYALESGGSIEASNREEGGSQFRLIIPARSAKRIA